jgi:hypothetical protein
MRLRSDDLSVRVMGDEMVLLDLRSSRYLSITGVGVDIVNLLSENRTEDELVAALLDRYDVDEEAARRDTTAFVTQLRSAGLVE